MLTLTLWKNYNGSFARSFEVKRKKEKKNISKIKVTICVIQYNLIS